MIFMKFNVHSFQLQAVLCCLSGVQDPPESTEVLEHVAGKLSCLLLLFLVYPPSHNINLKLMIISVDLGYKNFILFRFPEKFNSRWWWFLPHLCCCSRWSGIPHQSKNWELLVEKKSPSPVFLFLAMEVMLWQLQMLWPSFLLHCRWLVILLCPLIEHVVKNACTCWYCIQYSLQL